MTGAEPETGQILTRRLVRRRERGLLAESLTKPEEIHLIDGRIVHAQPGEIRIMRGEHTVDLLPAKQFAERYEVVVSGGLQLSVADCARIEETAGLGSTQSSADLVKAIERLFTIKIGDIRIPFTPGQLAELSHRASKRGRTVEAEMKAVVDRIQDELFYKGG